MSRTAISVPATHEIGPDPRHPRRPGRRRPDRVSGRARLAALLLVVLVGLLFGTVSPARAQGEEAEESTGRTFHLDPEATEVRFTLGATLHTVRGTAQAETGTVRFDEASGEASGRIRIDARSLETGNEGRDEAMHQDVLESERYPEIVFVAESYRGSLPTEGAGKITLKGKLEIHGASHPLELPLEIAVRGGAVNAEGGFQVPFVAWGMKDPSKLMLRVDKEVEVELSVRGRLTARPAGPAGGKEPS